jgi:PAS domain S-box-containing protein
MMDTGKEISCRITRTLLMYVRYRNDGSLAGLLDGLELDEAFLLDTNNWVSHAFLQVLYHRMIEITQDENAVYKMTVESKRFHSMGLLDRIVRLVGNPGLIYAQAAKYNRLLKSNGDVYVHELGDSWVLLEDRYHISAQKTRYDCDFTRAVLAGIPTMFNLPFARVEEIECQVAAEKYGLRHWPDTPVYGSRGCLYRVRWSSAGITSLWTRLLTRGTIRQKAIEDLLEANSRIQEKYAEVRKLAADLEAANRELLASRKQQELNASKLRASEQKYRLLAETITDVIWTYKLGTLDIGYVSPSVKEQLGFAPDELIGSRLEQILEPESHQLLVRTLAAELERDSKKGVEPGGARTLEIRQRNKGGVYVWADIAMTFIRDEARRPVEVLGVTRDISERKRAEEAARDLTAKLQRAQKMEAVGNLAAGVAHDLNNTLVGLVGYPELLLLDLPETSPLREGLITIQRSGERAAAIVDDMLTLARRGVAISEVLNLNRIVSDYRKSHEHKRLQRAHTKARLNVSLSDELLDVKGSPVHLTKMLTNLISNAAESMPAGGSITLSTQNTCLDMPLNAYEMIPQGDFVLLSVADEGIGIPEEHLKRIFEPFFTKRSMGRSGTGLGMTVIWAAVKDSGGFINLTSREGEGTRFDIYLPITREARAGASHVPVLDDYLGNETILVVDDIEEQRDIATRMLGRLGYVVTAVSSGEAAVTYMQAHTVDLLILDMIMDPGIDGLETYQRILEKHPRQKAIIASGYSESERVKALQTLGAGAYVKKPYTLEKIGMAVRNELNR